jgi:uncharacterized membrane protein
MQLKLFLGPEDATVRLWEQLDPDARRMFLQALARAIAKAVAHPPLHPKPEDAHDR